MAGYPHVLINHLPIIGTAMGLLAVLIGLFLRNRAALIPGLVVVLIAGASAVPVYLTGGKAYRPIMKIADAEGQDWLNEHTDRADQATWVFYGMALVALAALVVPAKWPKSTRPLGVATVLAALAGLGAAAYIAKPGGMIRHAEFRAGQAPISGLDTEESTDSTGD